MIIKLLGGIRLPNAPPAAAIAPPKAGSYLIFIIEGIITAPIAAVVAGPDPDNAAKNAQPKTATRPRLPVTFPISDSAILTILLAIPPCSINEPANTNKGTVINGKGSTPVYIEFAIPAKSRSSIK